MNFQARDLMMDVLNARQGFAREAGLQLCDDVTRRPGDEGGGDCDDVTRKPGSVWEGPGLELAHLQQQLHAALTSAQL